MLNITKTTWLKWSFFSLFAICFIDSFSQSDKENYTSIYAQEFKQIKKITYNTKLFSLSDIKLEKKWNNYQGGAINTADSLFYFNNDQLCSSFPTNSDKIRNEYLAFYFSQKSAKCPTLFSLLKLYQPIIENNLKINNLPKELGLLPAVLSAFNPSSSNGIGGEGYWHLNYPQAVKYGLTVNKLIDERRDFEKSTKAATRYIKDLYVKYDDWELTLTAYSSGVVTVNKLLKRHSATTYKEIYPYLPNETKDLVQAFVAMNYIYNYDSYGAIQPNPNIKTDTVLIERKLKFEAINHVIKTKSSDFKFLNPTLNRETFPTNFNAYFPKGTKDKFLKFKDSIYFYQDSVMRKPASVIPKFIIPKNGDPFVYRVRSGDVLGVIAERFNVRVSQIQNWNNLNGTRIDIGQKLTIYGKKKSNGKTPKPKIDKLKPTDSKPKDVKTIISKGVKTTYTVKSGDNLWLIAKKFSGVSAQNIMDFNGIDGNLDVGQVLKIPKQ
ncbi:MAG: LysM peptidoglycan-binding domain-containing protein [Flavobacteriales bacterium]|nr:LysM peptidoglycan-binding domain-containing protein [Flavobacteriales bacterium]